MWEPGNGDSAEDRHEVEVRPARVGIGKRERMFELHKEAVLQLQDATRVRSTCSLVVSPVKTRKRWKPHSPLTKNMAMKPMAAVTIDSG